MISPDDKESMLSTNLEPISVAYTRPDMEGENHITMTTPTSTSVVYGTRTASHHVKMERMDHGELTTKVTHTTRSKAATSAELEWIRDPQRMPHRVQEARLRSEYRTAHEGRRSKAAHPVKPSLQSARISKAERPPPPSSDSVYSGDNSSIASTYVSTPSHLQSVAFVGELR
jgi:hypothetical protein